MTFMTPILIGYFAKRTLKNPADFKTKGVEEVCSVSTCLSKAPEGWLEHSLHNELGIYDTPELAIYVVPEPVRHEFELFAYRIFPFQFINGQMQPFAPPELPVEPLSLSFERLGYDVVNRDRNGNFECSPLSCNHMATHFSVTRLCLLKDADVAFGLATGLKKGQCKPGPYFVIEVWRRKTVN